MKEGTLKENILLARKIQIRLYICMILCVCVYIHIYMYIKILEINNKIRNYFVKNYKNMLEK